MAALNGTWIAPQELDASPLGNESHINGTLLWQDMVFISSGTLSSAAVLASFLLIWGHLRNWTVPEHQTHIVRILIMVCKNLPYFSAFFRTILAARWSIYLFLFLTSAKVPIYAIDSWLSLRFREYSLYFDIARDCYEAYVLHQFFSLLLAYIEVGRPLGHIESVLEAKPKQNHPFPCCCLPRFAPGPLFLLITKQCILQYVIIRPLMTIVAAILHYEEVYFEGSFLPTHGYLWVAMIVNASVTVSMYFLVLFYLVMEKQLSPFSVVAKLASVKAILFFSFWQTVIIGILVFFNVIPSVGDWKSEEVATGLNNWILCMEMFILSVVHHFVFPYQQYTSNESYNLLNVKATVVNPVINFGSVIDQKDLIHDIRHAYSPARMKHAKIYQEQLRARGSLDEGSEGERDRDSMYEEDVDGVSFYSIGTPASNRHLQ